MLPKHDPQFLTPIRRWEKRVGFVTPLRWVNVISILLYHLFLTPTTIVLQQYFDDVLILRMTGFGVTAGAHRYWCHRSYKAKTPLRLILLLCYTMAGQNTIFEWVRDHRVHHKHSETAADPHDVTRGFWFSHVGWLMMKKRPEVLRAGRAVDMSDILRDPLVAMHTRNLFPNLNHQHVVSFWVGIKYLLEERGGVMKERGTCYFTSLLCERAISHRPILMLQPV
ncbi:Delta(9)-fatty-acid desaturase fat-6 [Eumeta japonica]|uniref:Delta(9)-fatty-acid desaturase fat-6 n=1 Tax=Eumeta variegata TaxID=151549 RepID=A0A4C1U8W6_EUMVA|nr:Delta(9)-fatty-acid desaturase fat-6 [Eumeta japonica]